MELYMIKKIFNLLVIIYMLSISSHCYSQIHNYHNDFKLKINLNNKSVLNNTNDKVSYALGASLGRYMSNSFREQKKLGIFLDNSKFILGLEDSMSGDIKLSSQEISDSLKGLEHELQLAAKLENDKVSKENLSKGTIYLNNFSKQKDVKTTKSGLFYLIEKEGNNSTKKLLNSSVLTVKYKGLLVDGTEFDSSYKRGKPFSFVFSSAIPGWKEGLKLINKGGKIKLVVPPKLAYKDIIIPGIPLNSTLIFDIELLDIKNL
ncbi:FKBP-type peptidyl-prolyl cis-trans isomerase, partial [Buchnera aphidicola (Hormaphis cornu)]